MRPLGCKTALTDHVDSNEFVEYAYDQLHRLTQMKVNSTVSAEYSYSSIGNLTCKKERTSVADRTLNYPTSGRFSPIGRALYKEASQKTKRRGEQRNHEIDVFVIFSYIRSDDESRPDRDRDGCASHHEVQGVRDPLTRCTERVGEGLTILVGKD